MTLLFILLILLFSPHSGVYGQQIQPAAQASVSANSAGDSCGKDTFTFGCHAYVIAMDINKVPGLASKGVQTVTIDAQAAAKNPSALQQLNKSGPLPIFYTNPWCEKRFGGTCQGPCISDKIASQFGECMQRPDNPDFLANYQRQLGWVKSVGGKYVILDNSDSYIDRGMVGGLQKLVQMAAQQGINVIPNNAKSQDLLKMSNVVAVITEPGSGSAQTYRSALVSAGKKCGGVLMINGKGPGDAYTSFTQGDQLTRGDRSEYTQFRGCTANSAGARVAGTPIATGNEIIAPTPPEQKISQFECPPGTFCQSQSAEQPQSSLGQGSTSAPAQTSAAPASAQKQSQQLGGCADNPNCTNSSLATQTIRPVMPFGEQAKVQGTEKSASKSELDALFGDDTTLDTPKKETDSKEAVLSGLSAKLTCAPKQLSRGEKVTLAWRCPVGTKGISESSDARSVFTTKNKRFGTVRAAVRVTTTYTLSCEGEANTEVLEPATCTVTVRRTNPTYSAPPQTVQRNDLNALIPVRDEKESEQVKSCFLGFCI
jgi:hypothetical protein